MTTTINRITLGLFLGLPWAPFLIWELVLLYLRGKGIYVQTISMVAKDYGPHMNSVVYLWAGLATHYWWNGQAWATVIGGVSFWVIALLLVIFDVCLWPTDKANWAQWLTVLRHPGLWMILGALAGRFLFPQRG